MPTQWRWWQIPILLVLVVAIAGIGATVLGWRTPETLITIAPLPTEAASVTVYVGGAVARPGLYTLAAGERVEGALVAAGGLTAEADPDGINRATRLRDEAQIVVPRRGQPTATPPRTAAQPTGTSAAAAASKGATPVSAPGKPINVNRAGADELAQLPGVGPKLAQAIIEYRTAHGPFASALDLALVQGISERMALGWEALVTFGP